MKYKATIELLIDENFDIEKFEVELDQFAINLAEEKDAKIKISNFYKEEK